MTWLLKNRDVFCCYFFVIILFNSVLSWGVGVGQELSGTGGCIVYTHWKGESEGKIGSPGLNFPVPEGSGVLNSKRKRVQKVSRCTGARGSTLVHSIRYRRIQVN